MATRQAQKRLQREFKHIQESPVPYIEARPNESHILEWHYVITGPPDTPYHGGQYHGTLVFPADYPFKPPAIRMMTPSGRFKTNTRLCLSISDYHPKSWNPAWSVSTILTGLLSFMVGDESTAGSIQSTEQHKKAYARESLKWNIEHNQMFIEHYSDLIPTNRQLIQQHAEEKKIQQAKSAALQPSGGSGNPAVVAQNDNNELATNNNNNNKAGGFFSFGKVVGICVVLVSWILASRLFGGL